MHRVRHSVLPSETNSNFGFNFPWRDRLMGLYKAQPSRGHAGMTIGLNQFRDPLRLTLPRMLVLPFIAKTGSYAIGHRSSKFKKQQRTGFKVHYLICALSMAYL
jgi:sterol desaturase/sphingolipid hydroxylase (fatty acid hydroxylase superfamily)